MERRATFRDYRHGTIEQVEAAYQNQLCHASEQQAHHGGYVGSLLRRAEHTMLGKQSEIESKAELQARYDSHREVMANHRLAPARAGNGEMQGPRPSSPPHHQEQDDLKRHLNGMRDKIAFYRSEKQKVTHILDVMGVSLQQASADAATAVPMAAQGHSPSPIPVHMQHSTSNTSFASLSSSPTIFTSPSPVLHHSPANIQTDIQKPDGMTDEHFERLKSIQSRIQGMPPEQATYDSPLLSPSFAVSTPDKDKRSPPRTSVENLRRQLEAVRGEIEAMEHDDP